MLLLPRFTFLNGPPSCGKSSIARHLALMDPNLSVVSFAEPIRMSLLATFYPESMTLGPDLRDGEVKKSLIPGTGVTHRRWMNSYGQWMKSLLGKQIFGDIAKRQVDQLSRYYDRFIFDDCRFVEEIRPFVNAFGGQQCLLVHVSRNGTSWDDDIGGYLDSALGLFHAGVNNNSSLIDAVSQLAGALNQPPVTPFEEAPLPLIEPSLDDL